MNAINAQTIIDQLAALALAAPEDATEDQPFTFVTIRTSERGTVKLVNQKSNLEAYAAKVRKSAAAFGGGLIKTQKTRPAVAWPAGPVKLVAEMLEDGQAGEAAALAIRKCGALFFMTAGCIRWRPAPLMAWAPQAVDGLPECFISARSSDAGNKWQVIHLGTGLKIGLNCGSRKAAEESAIDAWTYKLNDSQRALAQGMTADQSTEDARAQYLAKSGLSATEDLQADPVPQRKPAKATAPAQAAPVAEVVAETIATAQAAAAIDSAAQAAAVDAIATAQAEDEPQAEEVATVAAMAEGSSHQSGRALIGRAAPAQVERGQVIASKSGNWSAVFFNCPTTGLPSMRFMHSDEDGRGQDAGTYDTGRERMADLQRKAKAADYAAAQRTEAARQTAKPAGLSITLERMEGPSHECDKPQTLANFEDADRLLWAWSETAPTSGGYNKIRAKVVWPDGTEYSERLDLVHHTVKAPSLRGELASTAEFWTGKRCPDHMTGEQYSATLARCSDSDRAFYAHMLDLLTQAGHFSKAQPQHCPDLLQLIDYLKIEPAGLVGFGVSTYSPDTSTTKAGAITSAEKITRSRTELKITVTYEDGTTDHLDAAGFADKPGARRTRHRLDGRTHGRPYLAQLAAAVASKKASDTSAKDRADQAHAQAIQTLRTENPALMTWAKAKDCGRKFSGHTLAAHNIRAMLKAAHPGVKFSVNSESFSGGNAITIKWTDGPTDAQVDAIAGKFSAGSFNGSEDIYEYSGSAWTDLFGSSKYITTSRELSDHAHGLILAQVFPDPATRPTVEDSKAGRVRDHAGRCPVHLAASTWTAPTARA